MVKMVQLRILLVLLCLSYVLISDALESTTTLVADDNTDNQPIELGEEAIPYGYWWWYYHHMPRGGYRGPPEWHPLMPNNGSRPHPHLPAYPPMPAGGFGGHPPCFPWWRCYRSPYARPPLPSGVPKLPTYPPLPVGGFGGHPPCFPWWRCYRSPYARPPLPSGVPKLPAYPPLPAGGFGGHPPCFPWWRCLRSPYAHPHLPSGGSWGPYAHPPLSSGVPEWPAYPPLPAGGFGGRRPCFPWWRCIHYASEDAEKTTKEIDSSTTTNVAAKEIEVDATISSPPIHA